MRFTARVFIVPCLIVLSHGVSAQTYHAVPFLHPDGVFAPASMNNAMQVSGYLLQPDASYHGLIRHASGRYESVPELAGNRSRLFGLNDLGDVGGWTLDGGGFGHPGVWRSGVFHEQSVPAGATTVPVALDLNNAGEATGYYRGAGSILHAFYWDALGNVTPLPELSGSSSIAYAINESGEIAGACVLTGGSNHAVRWKKNSQSGVYEVLDLGSLGGPNSIANDINEAGQIVGAAQNTDSTNHAFLWESGTMEDLGTAGGQNSGAYAINNNGVIAAASEPPPGAAWTGISRITTDLRVESTRRAAAFEDRPFLPGSEITAPTGLVVDIGAIVVPNKLGAYVWVNLNDVLPSSNAITPLTQALNINDLGGVYGMNSGYDLLIPDNLLDQVCGCSDCPDFGDGNLLFAPQSGSFTMNMFTSPGATQATTALPNLMFVSPVGQLTHNGSIGKNVTSSLDWEAEFFGLLPLPECVGICQPPKVMNMFEYIPVTTLYNQSTGDRLDQLVIPGPVSASSPAGTAQQPETILHHEADNLFYFFGADGKLSAQEDGNGNRRDLTYTNGKLTQIADNFGKSVTLTYDGNNHVSSMSDGTRTFTFGYTGENLTSITDPGGHTTSFTYDDTHPLPGLLKSVTLPKGNIRYQFSYDLDGRLASVTTANGGTWTIAYEANPGGAIPYPFRSRETSITDPLGHTVQYMYDSTGHLTGVIDQAGSAVQYGYDADGLLSSTTDRMGGTSQVVHDPVHHRPNSVTEADGTTRTYSYTTRPANGLNLIDLTGIQFPDGLSDSYTYDASGNLTSYQDRDGGTWTYTYDTHGQMLTATNPLGGATQYGYNPDGTLSSITDNSGHATTLQYDAMGRIIQAQYAGGSQVLYTYDLLDHILSGTDENGATRELTYDVNGNLTAVKDAQNRTAQFGYNNDDRVTSFTDHNGAASTFTYDLMNRVTQATDRNGNAIAVAYDARGRVQHYTDGSGFTWQYGRDAEGIITSATDPLGNASTFTSDDLGRTTGITRGTASVSFTRDILGRLTGITGPGSDHTTSMLNPLGLPEQITLPSGASAQYSFDAAGRLLTAMDPGGSSWSQMRDPQGRLSSRTDPLSNMTSYTHDSRNRPATATLPGGLGLRTVTYSPTGYPTGEGYSDATSLTFSYDADGQLQGMTGATLGRDANSRVIESNGITMARDAGGRMTSMTLAPGKVVTYAYDSRNLPTSVTDWLGATITLSYDDAGRLTGTTRPNGISATLTYDDQGRIASLVEGSIASLALTRNPAGRITDATRTTPFAPDSLTTGTRSLSFDATSQVAGFTYDAMGRLLSDGKRTYAWDLASRLKQYTEGANTVMFTYDAVGNRLTRSAGGVTRSFVWNYAWDLPSVCVERDNGTDVRYFIYTPQGVPLSSIEASDGERHFYHFDEAGNTLFLSDDAGAVIAAYAYSPYGVLLGSTGAIDNPFTFGGQSGVQQEGATGLYYMRARYYDSETARFISRDQLQSPGPQLLNPYQYALGNPLQYVDPTGLKPFDVPSSPQAPEPLRPRSEFSSDQSFNDYYNDWNAQMQQWLKDVRENDRKIDELRTQHDADFLQEWTRGWEEYGNAVTESNTLVFNQELLARGHDLGLTTVRELYKEGITTIEDFEAYVARYQAAAKAVHEQAIASARAGILAYLASRREAAKPCPVVTRTRTTVQDEGDSGPNGLRLLTQERKTIKAGLQKFRNFFGR